MIKWLKNKNGITLMALTITIIILLILAGVSISMISGENGLLNLTKNAKDQTNEQIVFEQIQMAAIAAMRNPNYEVNKEQLDKELEQYGYAPSTGSIEEGFIVIVEDKTYLIDRDGNVTKDAPIVTEPPTTEVAEKTKFQDPQSNNKVAVIPQRFKVSSKADEQRIDTGLVVIAPDGSEFVWVPVEDASTMYGVDSDGNYLGKLYENGDINSPLNWTESNGNMSLDNLEGYREPDILNGQSMGDMSPTGLNFLKEVIGIKETEQDNVISEWKQ